MTTTTTRLPSPPSTGAGGGAVHLRQVGRTYDTPRGPRQALADIDLRIDPGDLVALVGPSGCGKSTLLGLVAGFAEPTSGDVLVDGRPVRGPGADRGVVFQQPRLLPWISVRANIELGPRFAGVARASRRQLAEDMLELVGLAGEGDRAPYELSGGMQQRAAIARALAGRPRILLLDEPFAALDALTREQLEGELVRIWRATGTTMVLVTHSVDEAAYVGSRVVALSRGPGRVVYDVAGLAGRDPREGLRSQPEFLTLRDAIHTVVVRAARGDSSPIHP